MSKKLIIFGLLGISIFFAIVTLGLSFSQIKDDHKGYDTIGALGCDQLKRPFKFTPSDDSSSSFLKCNWGKSRNAVRIIYTLFFIIVAAVLVFSILKSSGLHLILTGLLVVAGAVGIFSFIYDAKTLDSAKKDCKGYYFLNGDPGKCHNIPYNATVAFNIFTALSILVTGGLSFLFRNSIKEN